MGSTLKYLPDGTDFADHVDAFPADFGFHGSVKAPARQPARFARGGHAKAQPAETGDEADPFSKGGMVPGGPRIKDTFVRGGHNHHPEGHDVMRVENGMEGRVEHHAHGGMTIHHHDGRVTHHYADGGMCHAEGGEIEGDMNPAGFHRGNGDDEGYAKGGEVDGAPDERDEIGEGFHEGTGDMPGFSKGGRKGHPHGDRVTHTESHRDGRIEHHAHGGMTMRHHDGRVTHHDARGGMIGEEKSMVRKGIRQHEDQEHGGKHAEIELATGGPLYHYPAPTNAAARGLNPTAMQGPKAPIPSGRMSMPPATASRGANGGPQNGTIMAGSGVPQMHRGGRHKER